ncbi:hypothetical protein ANRL4_02033 [Anaerolineae bacterium]|nr:hypothetical protein ANRL4_02033 [Anaerolineae bacterium]
MHKIEVGLWIDHRQAVVVTLTNDGEIITRVSSNAEERLLHQSGSHTPNTPNHNLPSEDIDDRRYLNHLNKYFDEIITHLRQADLILVFGPGEAKIEFQKRLEAQGLDGRILAVESADKMSDAQLAAEIRSRFIRARLEKKQR